MSIEYSPLDFIIKNQQIFWRENRKSFLRKIAFIALALQLLFVSNFSYLYGSLWGSNNRAHALKVLSVDLDGGVISQSVKEAYDHLRGPGFPSLLEPAEGIVQSVSEAAEAVRDGTYWAAFVVHANASARLDQALKGGAAAKAYQASEATTYIWNEVRYPPFSDEMFESNFQLLAQTARQTYFRNHGQTALRQLDATDEAAVQVLLNPIGATGRNIMPTDNPTRLLYNTASTVMPILQEFFFLLILNGLSDEMQINSKVPIRITSLFRVAFAVTYTFISSLGMMGYIWAFRESWSVDARQFVLSWMVLWFLHQIHFLVIDTVSAFLPIPALPFFLLTWIILNLTSTVSPLELNPVFYRWGYALPANEAYTALTDIWSNGAVPALYRALPIMGAWWLVGMGMAVYAHIHRCQKASRPRLGPKSIRSSSTSETYASLSMYSSGR
ncbi:hypothetical protein EDD37DRAFT_509742 [Exophiala viscosa]|uniref:uncharacterized protein n=1 Tax=Exophiala viscosa TaxID=2486360 RepID=UPI00219205B5|nr:hypothetical protein EDD37DRAFT_509742 [Exophiala viscosa]